MDKALSDLIDNIQFTEKVAARIHGVYDEDTIFRIVTEEFVSSERSMTGILMLDDDGSTLNVAQVSLGPDVVKTLEQAAQSPIEEFRIDLVRGNILSQVVIEGKTLKVSSADIFKAMLPAPLESLVMDIMQMGREPSILTPLHRRDRVVGVLMIMAPELADYFIPSVRSLARHISTALELAYEQAERRRAEEAMQVSEKHFRSLIENAPDIIGIIDEDASIRYMSPSAEKVTGYTADELMGENAFKLMHPDDMEKAREVFTRGVQAPGSTASMEVRFRRKDGSWGYADFIARYLLDDPSVGGIVLNCRDITERKLAEQALEQSEQKFRAIVENAPDQFVIVERDGTISFVNYAEPGFELNSVIGTSVYDYVDPAMADKYHQTQERVFRTGKPERIEVMNIVDRIHDCRVAPLAHGGRWDRLMVILTDITEQKRAEEALRQSETRYRQLFDYAPDGVMILDGDGRILECSHSAMLLYGYPREEMIGSKVTDFMHPASIATFSGMSYETEQFEGEIRIIRSDGSLVHLWRKGVPLMDADGNLAGVLLYDRDITDRKRAEELLRTHQDHLEKLVQERTSSLEEANTALRVMLKTADQVKSEVEEAVLFNVKRFALPYLEELNKSGLNERQHTYLDLLRQSLDQVTQPFLHGVSSQFLTLTPTEVMVMDLIRQGKSSKEIADLLNMSIRTVETHRYNIRTKLGLKDRSVNLRTYISSIEDYVERLSNT
ncbi:MAG: PAS domain S-box protein [Dehalococcoidia bacterium]